MQGFKSFPKKTEIPLTQGINVILGPNGSGKSNVSDAICFVLGRLSIKSLRAAKASNLIFLGTKSISASKEASVEIILDNSRGSFSIEEKEISIKRIVRKNGQSIYKINNKTKTRQEVLSLLAQAGIDPKGFNMILQGEIQNLVGMHSEERRKIIEEVSGISIYESRKEKSLKELEKTEDRLKEIHSILRERTAYLNNLEKERKQALKFKKLQEDVKKLKASIIHSDLNKKSKELERINSQISQKGKEIEKVKNSIASGEAEVKNLNSKIDSINSKIQDETGLEQEKINREIANLRAEIAGTNVRIENYENKLSDISQEKAELKSSIMEFGESLEELEILGEDKNTISENKLKEVSSKKEKLEGLEEQRKRFYMMKSELKSLAELLEDKTNDLQNSTNESDFILKQIESLTIEIFDKKSNGEKLEKLKISLAEKRDSLKSLLKRESEIERTNYLNEAEIENQKNLINKISKMDICPICKNKITPDHMKEIQNEIKPKIDSLKKQTSNSDVELNRIYQRKDIFEKDLEQISLEISKTEDDLSRISKINDKMLQIKNLQERIDRAQEEISNLNKRKKNLQDKLRSLEGVEKRYETLKIEVEEVSLRSQENVDSEISFKRREIDRIRISIKELSRNNLDLREEMGKIKKIAEEKQKSLSKKRAQEEALSLKFKNLISSRDSFQTKIRNFEITLAEKSNGVHSIENEINEMRISKARVDAETEI